MGIDPETTPGGGAPGLRLGRPILIASNRGPVDFDLDPSGEPVGSRGAGGLVTALSHVMSLSQGTWVAAALTAGDREVARRSGGEPIPPEAHGVEGFNLRYLSFERSVFNRYYHQISNRILWFMQHAMWNLPLQPRFVRDTHESWECYREVNEGFAQAIFQEMGRGQAPLVMVHDYHLMLVGSFLRKLDPQAFSYHFSHCPWAQPDTMRVLPEAMAAELLEGMLAFDLLGFQTSRWAANFLWCCEELLLADVDHKAGVVRLRGRETSVRAYPISIEVPAVRSIAFSGEGDRHAAWVERLRAGRRLLLRVDRMEPSKNIVRGFLAYERFLLDHPEWQGQVVHLAILSPSRRALREYREYEAEVLDTHDRINQQLGTDDWQPAVLIVEDDYPRALACLRRYDALFVNPIADGMNLVAKEGPAVNERDGVLILSRNAGAWFELAHAAISVNPYDIEEMSAAIAAALAMDPPRRAEHAAALRRAVEGSDPAGWLGSQAEDIAALEAARL